MEAEFALRILDEAGLNLRGFLSAESYDALVPPEWHSERLMSGARSIVVVGSGGRALYEAFLASPEHKDPGKDPLDAYCQRILGWAASSLAESGFASRALFYHERCGEHFADFVALGKAAGLGGSSRLSLLLNPRYGPWMSLRAVILTEFEFSPSKPLESFEPCRSCPAPCATACRGGALEGGRFSVSACFQGRVQHEACRMRCDARRACVLGRDHAYLPSCEAHHSSASLAALRISPTP